MPPRTMFGDSFADQALGGQSALSGIGQRSVHHDSTPSMVYASVVAVHYATHSVDCVGMGSVLNTRFNNVAVLSSSFTSKDGTTNLPVIKRPSGSRDLDATNPGNEIDAIAVLVFAQNDPSKPVCIGFLYPKEQGEVLFEEEGLSIDRHNSNVYERLDSKGNWEFVFPDSTYMKIARTDELPDITNLTAKNANNPRRKWQIDYDHDRMIILSHAFGSQLRLGKDGLGIIGARRDGVIDPVSGLPISTQNLSWSFNSDGSIVSNFTSLSWTTPNGLTYNIDKDGNIVTNMSLTVNNSFTVTGTTNLPFETYVDGKRIDLLISEIAKWYTENHHHQYYDNYGEGSTDTRWTDGVEITDTLTISPASGAATGGTTGGTTADTGTGTTGSATESLQLSVGIEPSKILFDQVSSEGTSTFAAHADHVHGLDTPATPASLTVLVPGLAGESSTPARSDHKHELLDVAGLKVPNIFTAFNTFQAGIQVTSASLSVASRWMGATENGAPATGPYNKGDFVVDVAGSFWICTAPGTPGTWVQAGGGGSGSGVGSVSYGLGANKISRISTGGSTATTTVSRSDHVHEIDATFGSISGLPWPITPGAPQSIGGVATKTVARSDHIHATPLLWPPEVHDIAGESHRGTLVLPQFSDGLITPEKLSFDPATQAELDAHANDATKHGGGSAATPGMVSYALKGTTSNGTSSVILTSDGTGTPVASNMIVITAMSVWSYNIVITANSLSGLFGGRWNVTGSVKRNQSLVTTTLVGDPSVDSYFDDQIKDVSFSIGVDNITLGALQISVIGLASTSIAWSAIVTLYGLASSPVSIITNGGGGAFGSGGSQSGYGRFTFASGKFVTDGDSQYGVQVLRGITTTNSSVTLTADGLSVNSENIPILKNLSSWMFEAKIVGNSGGVASTMWALTGLIRRGASSSLTAVVGILDIKSTSDAALESVGVSVDADITNGGLALVVTGVLATTIHWVAVVQSVEVL